MLTCWFSHQQCVQGAGCRILPAPENSSPKTICSSDYGGGSHTGPLLFALLIVRILSATSGRRGDGADIWHIWSQLSIWCLSLGYLFNIFPRGSLSIRERRAVGSTSALNRDCGRFKGNGSSTIFQRGISGYQPDIRIFSTVQYFKEECLDITQVS